jgi:hypothetical protein
MRMLLRILILLCLLIFFLPGWYGIPGLGKKRVFAFEIDADRVLWRQSACRASGIFNILEPEKIKWHRLALNGTSLLGKVNSEVRLTALPAKTAMAQLMAVPEGTAALVSGATIFYITIDSNIQPLIGSAEKVQTQSWVIPKNAVALQRIRLRKGRKIWQKSYRFHPNGVYHMRNKPVDKKQLELSPEQWPTVEKKFFQYNRRNKLECPAVIEPSGLLYLVSGIDLREQKSPQSLCVFDKQQLHRVTVTVGGRQQLKVNYLERSPDQQIRREGTIDVIKISFQPRSLASPKMAPEEFSFLGLKGDFDIFIDQTSSIPVQVSGKISTFGKVDIRLQEVNLMP